MHFSATPQVVLTPQVVYVHFNATPQVVVTPQVVEMHFSPTPQVLTTSALASTQAARDVHRLPSPPHAIKWSLATTTMIALLLDVRG
jgi:hypothetical protein